MVKLRQNTDNSLWPHAIRLLIDSIAIIFMRAYWLARCRAASHGSRIVRLLAERDDALWRLALAERMLAVQARRLGAMIRIRRHRYRDDPHLPDLELEIEWAEVA